MNVRYCLSWREGHASWVALLRLWLVSLALIASVRTSYSDEECVFPDAYGAAFVRPENRLGEFRVALRPPNYHDSISVRNHLVFSTVLGRLIGVELLTRTRAQCHAVAIDNALFPDLRVYLFKDASIESRDFDCLRELKDVVVGWEPSTAEISEAALQMAALMQKMFSEPSSASEFARSILRNALTDIYNVDTVMHSIVSVDTNPSSYQSLDARAFTAWIDGQRLSDTFDLGRLSLCDPQSNPQYAQGGAIFQNFPHSDSVRPGPIRLSPRLISRALPPALRHVLIVGDDRAVANAPYSPVIAEKYCNKNWNFDIGSGAGPMTEVRIRCLTEDIHNIDAWMVFFCEPEDCKSEHAAEIVAAAIAADPDVLKLAESSKGASRGPYLVEIPPRDDK